MFIVHLFHIIGQCHQIVKTDRAVVFQRFNFLNMINFVKHDLVLFSVNNYFSVFIGFQYEFFKTATKIYIRVFSKNPEPDAFQFLVCVISVNLHDLKRGNCTFSFGHGTVRLCSCYGFVFIVYAHRIDYGLAAVSSYIGIICDNYHGRIRNRISRYCSSCWKIILVLFTA